MKSKKKKKKVTIKDIIRLIVLLVAFSVLLYPTFSSYLNEKNGSKVVSYYDEESVKLSKAEKEQMLEDARAYNKEMLGNVDLIDPFSQEDVEIDARYESVGDHRLYLCFVRAGHECCPAPGRAVLKGGGHKICLQPLHRAWPLY